MLTGSLHRRRRAAAAARMHGVTLIEMLIAFVLLGLLVRLGLPSFTTWISNAQVRTTAESLQYGIRLAQSESIRRNRQVVLTFTNAAPVLNAAAVAGGRNWSVQTVAQFGATDAVFVQGGALADVASNVSISSGASTVTALCFNSMGRLVLNAAPGPSGSSCAVADAAFTIDRDNADRPLRVVVGVAGQVRMCDPNRPTQSDTSPDGCPA